MRIDGAICEGNHAPLLKKASLLSLNRPWYDFVAVSFCKLVKELAERMEKKTLEEDF